LNRQLSNFTKPDVKFHWIEDGHLETILKVDPSWPQVIFGISFGYVLAEFRNVLSFFQNQQEHIFLLNDLIFLGVFSIACAASILTGIQSIIAMSKNKKTLKKIRSREAIPLN
jgi:hypothetical protein